MYRESLLGSHFVSVGSPLEYSVSHVDQERVAETETEEISVLSSIYIMFDKGSAWSQRVVFFKFCSICRTKVNLL